MELCLFGDQTGDSNSRHIGMSRNTHGPLGVPVRGNCLTKRPVSLWIVRFASCGQQTDADSIATEQCTS